ncbi:hypothetical protein IJT93_13285 [bacterium]|nr:hypothetical protein [bacterium]
MYSKVKIFSAVFLLLAVSLLLPALALAQATPYTVAVLDFDNGGGYGDATKAAKAIPSILTTDLSKSNRFSVIEREQLEKVLKEQNLGASGLVNPETAARIGEIFGVEYLIVGKIVEMNRVQGRHNSFSVLGFGGSNKAADKVNVSVEVKVIDSESARIVAAVDCRKSYEIGKGGSSINILGVKKKHDDYGGQDAGLADVYYAISHDLAEQLETVQFKALPAKVKYTGFIGHVENKLVYINLGRKQGVTRKMVFNVRREEKKGSLTFKKTLGKIRALNVDDTVTECEILEQNDKFKQGDLVESKF